LKPSSQLAFRVPALVGVTALLAGCYTMFSHPETDMADSFRDSRHSDCATCHRVGFETPLAPDPYGYVAFPFQNFYTPCPWWVDCGSGGFIGGAAAGGGSGDTEAAKRRSSVERYLGIRGGTRPDSQPSSPPAAAPAGTSTGDSSSNPGAASGTKEDQGGQQSGRTMKKDSSKPDARDDRKPDPNRRQR